MRRQPRSTLLPAGQNEEAAPSGPVVPLALLPHEQLDLQLRQVAIGMARRFFEFCDLAGQAIADKIYERFGYLGPDAYFNERIGISARTVQKYLRILAAVRALPEAEQAPAREALAAVGSHKAKILVPVLEQDPAQWQVWVDRAQRVTEEALQEAVSVQIGARPRGAGAVAVPGEAFLRYVVNQMPPELQAYVERVFQELMRYGGITNAVFAFLVMVDLTTRDLAAQGVMIDGAPDHIAPA